MRIQTAIFLSVCIASACGKKNDSSSSDSATALTAPFFTLADITAGSTLATLTQSSMEEELESSSAVYNNSKDKTDDSSNECFTKLGEQIVQATKTTLTFSTNTDVSCSKTESGVSASLAGNVKIYIQLVCSSDDLSAMNGKKFSEIENTKCTKGTFVQNSLIDLNTTLSISGKSVTANSKLYSYKGKSDLSPCAISGRETPGNDCIAVERKLSSASLGLADQVQETYSNLTFKDLTDEDSDSAVWHSGGSISFTVNSWKGTLTYTASKTAPTYTASDNGGATVTGKLTAASAALNLAQRMNKLNPMMSLRF